MAHSWQDCTKALACGASGNGTSATGIGLGLDLVGAGVLMRIGCGNRMAWVSADYDRAYQTFTQTLETNDRVRYIAEMHRLVSEDLPVTPYWLRPVITAHAKGLKGPVARQTGEVQYATLGVWTWEWDLATSRP